MSTPPNIPPEMLASKPNMPFVPNKAFPQPCYHFVDGAWIEATSKDSTTAAGQGGLIPSRFRLITWNIDALIPHAEERMAGALSYLQELYNQTDRSLPVVILLQEMINSDLDQIQRENWIRERFYITDTSSKYWESAFYGTTTLIDKRLVVEKAFRVHYENTRMQRDGLFVDISVRSGANSPAKLLRVCNTHLESLVSDPPRRPPQLKLAASYLGSSPGDPEMRSAHGGVLAGDLNAFAPEDLTAPSEVGLQDAFLVLGGVENTDEGYTWGQQVPEEMRKAFGCSRMDKVLFCGGVQVTSLRRIGGGVTVEVDTSRENVEGKKDMWVTDHLGLMADFTIVELSSGEF